MLGEHFLCVLVNSIHDKVLGQIEREAADAALEKSEHKSVHVTFLQGGSEEGGDAKHSGVAELVNGWEESAAEDFIAALTDSGNQLYFHLPT